MLRPMRARLRGSMVLRLRRCGKSRWADSLDRVSSIRKRARRSAPAAFRPPRRAPGARSDPSASVSAWPSSTSCSSEMLLVSNRPKSRWIWIQSRVGSVGSTTAASLAAILRAIGSASSRAELAASVLAAIWRVTCLEYGIGRHRHLLSAPESRLRPPLSAIRVRRWIVGSRRKSRKKKSFIAGNRPNFSRSSGLAAARSPEIVGGRLLPGRKRRRQVEKLSPRGAPVVRLAGWLLRRSRARCNFANGFSVRSRARCNFTNGFSGRSRARCNSTNGFSGRSRARCNFTNGFSVRSRARCNFTTASPRGEAGATCAI